MKIYIIAFDNMDDHEFEILHVFSSKVVADKKIKELREKQTYGYYEFIEKELII